MPSRAATSRAATSRAVVPYKTPSVRPVSMKPKKSINSGYVIDNKMFAMNALSRYYVDIKPIYEIDPVINESQMTDDDDDKDIRFLQSNINKSFTLKYTYAGNNSVVFSVEEDRIQKMDFYNFYRDHENDFEKKDPDGTILLIVPFNVSDPNTIGFNENLRTKALPAPMNECTPDQINNAPLVMIITAKNIEHAIICILEKKDDGSSSSLYTIGFGYELSEPGKNVFEGALYSSDILLPKKEQKCQIIWMGLLDEKMCAKIDSQLKFTTEIKYDISIKREIYKGEHYIDDYKDTVTITPNTKLSVGMNVPYCKYPNYLFGSDEKDIIKMNCLKWALTMLDAKVFCGPFNSQASMAYASRPSTCRTVLDDQFTKIMDYWMNNKDNNLSTALNQLHIYLNNNLPLKERISAELECIWRISLKSLFGKRKGGKYKARHISKARHTRKARHISKARNTRKFKIIK